MKCVAISWQIMQVSIPSTLFSMIVKLPSSGRYAESVATAPRDLRQRVSQLKRYRAEWRAVQFCPQSKCRPQSVTQRQCCKRYLKIERPCKGPFCKTPSATPGIQGSMFFNPLGIAIRHKIQPDVMLEKRFQPRQDQREPLS